MAAKGNSVGKVPRNLQGLTAILTSAACEWFLIFLLLVYSALSHLLAKFAHHCKLQTPCILCSRLHIFGNKKTENYHYLLCRSHRLEISSLIFCHVHDRLANGIEMCEDCLLSSVAKNNSKSNPEKHRLFLDKMRSDFGCSGSQSPYLNMGPVPGSIGTRPCSCCNKPWWSKQNSPRGLQLKSSNKPNVHLPRLSRRDNVKKIMDKSSCSTTLPYLEKTSLDPLSRVRYTELKFSGCESEFILSDDENGSNVTREEKEPREEIGVPTKKWCDDHYPAKSSCSSFETMPSLLDIFTQYDVQRANDMKFRDFDACIGHGLGEIDWKQAQRNSKPSEFSELTSLDDVPSTHNAMERTFREPIQKNKLKISVPQKSNFIDLSELVILDDAPPYVGTSPEKKSTETGRSGRKQVAFDKHEDILKSTSTIGRGFQTNQVVDDPTIMKTNNLDHGDVSESAVSGEELEVSSSAAKQPSIKEIDKIAEDINLLSSQNPSAKEIKFSSNNTTRNNNHNNSGDELQMHGASSANVNHAIEKSASVESGLESLDGSLSEIEGENIVDRFKRQIEYDKKCISSLHKELEKERYASEVAANQAMAMITRLQEEKAALHMDALQYLRMMEEQAEYDGEALQKANDLLTEKEKDIQDLVAELEFYHLRNPGNALVENDDADVNGENVKAEKTSASCRQESKEDADISSNLMITEVSDESNKALAIQTLSLEFEEEKSFIQQCLESLEMKIRQISPNRISSNVLHSGKLGDVEKAKEDSIASRSKETREENDDHSASKEGNSDLSIHTNSKDRMEVHLDCLEYEVSDLNDRLEALEADYVFLEHMINSLQNGSEGLQFVLEIACHLQELRKITIT